MKYFLTFFYSLYCLTSFAQVDHRISPTEKAAMPAYLNARRLAPNSSFTSPPLSPVRASAEWEEIDALMVAWVSYPPILTEIVRAAQTETQVIILCADSVAVKTTLTNSGVPLVNLHFLEDPFNSIWCRDYGQWNVYSNDVDSLFLIDWIYNRPRPKDDTVPAAIQRFTGLPMYAMTTAPFDLVHTGGNFMVDGFGTAFSSKLILDENQGKTAADIDTIMKKFMGINRYVKMETLPYDQIHHIDMHMKLLDEETLLVGEYPPGIADGPQIEANLQYVLSNFTSVYGRPYKVVRIPMPADSYGDFPDHGGEYRTYTNSVFVNKTVILPFYDEQYDTTAVRIYQEALPGYRIVGVDCNGIISLSGAIHCITKEVASSDPLLISHQPLGNSSNTTSGYVVDALIRHRSGIQSANLYYSLDTATGFTSLPMAFISGDMFEGVIPPQPAGTTIFYYISAESVSGKHQVRPMPAPAAFWKFNVELNTHVKQIAGVIGSLYPNPSEGLTCIPVNTSEDAFITVSMINIFGETTREIFTGHSTGQKNYFVNTTGLSPGVYFIRVTGDISSTKKIVVK